MPYASVAYPNDVEKIISLFEVVVGVGNASGLILGALVTRHWDLKKFFTFSVLSYCPSLSSFFAA